MPDLHVETYQLEVKSAGLLDDGRLRIVVDNGPTDGEVILKRKTVENICLIVGSEPLKAPNLEQRAQAACTCSYPESGEATAHYALCRYWEVLNG